MHCKFLIVLPICLKTGRSNVSFILQGKLCAFEKSARRRNFECPSERDRHRARNLSTTDIWCNNKRTLLALHFKKKALPSILFLNLVQKESLVPWDTFSIKLIVEHRIAQADDYC